MNIINNKIELDDGDFSFVCPLKTSNMKKVDGGHFCDKCEKKVYDVSDFTPNEFKEFQSNNSDVCISFKKVAIVSLALSLSACSSTYSHKVGKMVERLPTKTDTNKTEVDKKIKPFKSSKKIKVDRVDVVELAGVPVPVDR